MRPFPLRVTSVLVVCALLAQTAFADTFTNVKLIVNTGDKGEEQEAILHFEEAALVIRSRSGAVLKTLAYADIKGAEYSYAKSPRWKSGIGLAVAFGIFALPVFFMKGKKHWLTIAAQKDFAVLRLDKNNYRIILPTFEARTGKQVEAVADER